MNQSEPGAAIILVRKLFGCHRHDLPVEQIGLIIPVDDADVPA